MMLTQNEDGMKPNSTLRSAMAELERRGFPYTVNLGSGGHAKVRIQMRDGSTRLLVCSRSASDWRAQLNQKSVLKRLLQEFL